MLEGIDCAQLAFLSLEALSKNATIDVVSMYMSFNLL